MLPFIAVCVKYDKTYVDSNVKTCTFDLCSLFTCIPHALNNYWALRLADSQINNTIIVLKTVMPRL